MKDKNFYIGVLVVSLVVFLTGSSVLILTHHYRKERPKSTSLIRYNRFYENKQLLMEIEEVELEYWYSGYGKDMFTTDFISGKGAEYISIFSDGELYAGRNRVDLRKEHKEMVRNLYKKIKEYNIKNQESLKRW